MNEEEYLDFDVEYLNYDPDTGEEVDTYDYESAGLISTDNCDSADPPRLCCGCKFEYECCGFQSIQISM